MVDMNLEPIRAISRGLMVLRVISREKSLSMRELSDATGLPYPTVCRIVRTLIGDGFVAEERGRKRFHVTGLVQSLSHGFHDHGALIEVARRHIVDLTERLHWPIVLATRLGLKMIVRDSTHTLTSRSLNHYHPGFLFPLFDSAAGLAYLAFVGEEELTTCTADALADPEEGPRVAELRELLPDKLAQIRQAGFATRERNMFTLPLGKNSSISVPIIVDGAVEGALAINFFASSMPMHKAIALYADLLRGVAEEIGRELAGRSGD